MAGESNRLAVWKLRGKVRAHQHADAERRDDPAKLNIALNRVGKR